MTRYAPDGNATWELHWHSSSPRESTPCPLLKILLNPGQFSSNLQPSFLGRWESGWAINSEDPGGSVSVTFQACFRHISGLLAMELGLGTLCHSGSPVSVISSSQCQQGWKRLNSQSPPLGTRCFHSSIYYQDEITEGGHLVVEMQYSDDIQIYTMTSGPSWKQTWHINKF